MSETCNQLQVDISHVRQTLANLQVALQHAVTQTDRNDLQRGIDAASMELSGLETAYRLNGCEEVPKPPPPRPKRPTIPILLVMDGSGDHWASFGPGDPNPEATDPKADAYFGLSEVVRTLADRSTSFPVYFELTKAHRDTDPLTAFPARFQALSPVDQALFKPDFERFRFDQHDLHVYDEIWLFGVGGPGETAALTDSELQALARFMDSGGGVFATGDHEDLGVQLCGRVPRVRSMRKWFFPIVGPLGEPVAPHSIGIDRIDTTQQGVGDPPPLNGIPVIPFDNQSDDIPQPIRPILLPVWSARSNYYFLHHPLLDYPGDVVSVLPDHMHEGEVITPWNLAQTLSFAGQDFVEYPPDASGRQVLPVIVATGQVLPHYTTTSEPAHTGDPNNIDQARSFVGAYDGHQTKGARGRVAVDSTWHHFFDLNLIGDPIGPGVKKLGFKGSQKGLAALDQVLRYHRNIGLWLARPERLAGLFAYAAYLLAHSQPLNMVRTKGRAYDAKQLLQIGALSRSALERLAPLSTQIDWLQAHLRTVGTHSFDALWTGPARFREPIPQIDHVALLEAAMGGAVVEVGQNFVLDGNQDSDGMLHRIAHEGVLRGFAALGHDLSTTAESIVRFANHLVARREAAQSR